jgi:NADPH-dependent 2,4-dienoyl-CoA reductase/sulfur reductase-like enzyme
MEIDAARRRVHVRDLKSGRSVWEHYDQLLIATGAVKKKLVSVAASQFRSGATWRYRVCLVTPSSRHRSPTTVSR